MPLHAASPCTAELLAKKKGDPAGGPAVPRCDTYSANVSEGSGENVFAILGLRSMFTMGAILILEQGAREDGHPWLICTSSSLVRLPEYLI
eukprot:7309612-Pyramimonas_sp.AAC.1